jgi:acyl-CoA reductase-like NAD-dependent aldehyde dehydrogenase
LWAGGAETRRRLRLASPATLAPIGEIEVQNPADVKAALERARKAQPGWAEISYEERGSYLQRAVRVMLERQDEFVEVLCAETGKPRIEALGGELMTACDALQYYAKRAKRILGDRQIPLHLLRTKKLRVLYKPLGVVGIITPWNYPFVLSLNPTVQALIAGNAVLLKPSEVTPFSGRLVAELLEAAGLPEGVFQLVLGDGETGAALVEAGLDKISFTGSVRTGRVVAEACARSLVPCTLELGGKDPMIVCADADLDRAARGAVFGAFTNSGQVCMSTERVYVVEEVAEAFTEKCLDHTAKLRQGAEGEFDVGSISWPHQLDIIEEHVRVVMRDETFGPVLPIMRVADEAEAVALANDSRYGLNASVWTRNKHKGAEIARMLESGCVVVNDCMVNYAATESPFGGVKDSGIGRVNGELGLKSYCHVQSVLTDRLGSRSEPLWYPYSERKLRRIQRTMRFLWGTSVGRFLS